jgi:hypothetical protein
VDGTGSGSCSMAGFGISGEVNRTGQGPTECQFLAIRNIIKMFT